MSFQNTPARVGSGEGQSKAKLQTETDTEPASVQAGKHVAFVGEISKGRSVPRANMSPFCNGLVEKSNIEFVDDDDDDFNANDSILDTEISWLKLRKGPAFPEGTMTIREFIQSTKDGSSRDKIENVRNVLKDCGGDKNQPDFKAAKLELLAIVVAGKITGAVKQAGAEGRIQYSKLMQIDIDRVEDPKNVRDELFDIPYILAPHVSPSGDGVKAFAFIGDCKDEDQYLASFLAIEADMLKRGHTIDTTCKNSNRFMFATWDPNVKIRTTPLVALKVPKSTEPPKAKKIEATSKAKAAADAEPVSHELVGMLKKKNKMARSLFENGNWHEHTFPSQSEADFSLACSICEITDDTAQQVALFQTSALYRDDRKLTLALKAARKRVEHQTDPAERMDFFPLETETTGFLTTRASEITGFIETRDLVSGVLIIAAMSVVYGPSNCGKSFWCLYLAVCVAMGIPFFGNEVEKGAVIYFGLEGSVGIRNRIAAMKQEGILDDDAPLHLCFSALSLLDSEHADFVAQTVARVEKEEGCEVKLIVIDTYARAMAGGDENSGKDTSAVVATVDAIRAQSKAHVMLIHHCGKDEARGARGHSSLRAATDTEIEITRPDAVSPSVVSVKKQRDLPYAKTTCFTLVSVCLGTDSRGDPLTSCVVRHDEGCEVPPRKAGRPRKASEEDVLKLLPQKNTTAWQAAAKAVLNIERTIFLAHIKVLKLQKRVLEKKGGGWEAKIQFPDQFPDHQILIDTGFEDTSPESPE